MNSYGDWQLAIACLRLEKELGRQLAKGELPTEAYVATLFGEEVVSPSGGVRNGSAIKA